MTGFLKLLGWWVCCGCGREVNLDIWGATCLDCIHKQCGFCHGPNSEDLNWSRPVIHQLTFQAVKTGGDETTETSVDEAPSGIRISGLLTQTEAIGKIGTTINSS
jgi:hypothetical protein